MVRIFVFVVFDSLVVFVFVIVFAKNLRWWRSSSARAGEIGRPALCCNRGGRRDSRGGRLQEDGQAHLKHCSNGDDIVHDDDNGQDDGRAHRLRVQRPPCAALLQHAFEAAVVPVGVFVINQSIVNLLVPVVGGVPDAEVVPAHRGEAFHSVTPVQAHRFDCRVVASVPG